MLRPRKRDALGEGNPVRLQTPNKSFHDDHIYVPPSSPSNSIGKGIFVPPSSAPNSDEDGNQWSESSESSIDSRFDDLMEEVTNTLCRGRPSSSRGKHQQRVVGAKKGGGFVKKIRNIGNRRQV